VSRFAKRKKEKRGSFVEAFSCGASCIEVCFLNIKLLWFQTIGTTLESLYILPLIEIETGGKKNPLTASSIRAPNIVILYWFLTTQRRMS
jgi:hypothetical protein